jgi:hypothetical protein
LNVLIKTLVTGPSYFVDMAAVWACHVHNEVNKSLEKEIFDCSKIGDFYDCGCAEDGDAAGNKDAVNDEGSIGKETDAEPTSVGMSTERIEEITGTNGRDFNMNLLKEDYNPKLDREG